MQLLRNGSRPSLIRSGVRTQEIPPVGALIRQVPVLPHVDMPTCRLGLIMLNTSGIQLACAIVLVVFGFYHLAMILIVRLV